MSMSAPTGVFAYKLHNLTYYVDSEKSDAKTDPNLKILARVCKKKSEPVNSWKSKSKFYSETVKILQKIKSICPTNNTLHIYMSGI